MAATPVQTDAPPVRRPRGRPRDPRVEGVVLGATRDLLLERGFGGLTIASVADAAGVGKGTIYLRWPDKESLVVAALADVWTPVEDPGTGSLRGDLLSVTRTITNQLNGTPGKLFVAVLGEMTRHRELRAMWKANVVDPWQALFAAIFTRGVERGEMRAGIDFVTAIDALLGPILSTVSTRGQKVTAAQAETFVDIFLNGVSA